MKLVRFRRLKSTVPPIFFNEHSRPKTIDELSASKPIDAASVPQRNRAAGFKDVILSLSLLSLSLVLFNMYQSLNEAQQTNEKLKMATIKSINGMKVNLNNYKRKQELQILQERKKLAQREWKMSLHIAMLKQQLVQKGLDPVEISKVCQEFEKSVLVENSPSNVSSQSLWLSDSCDLKSHFPDVHEYDRKR